MSPREDSVRLTPARALGEAAEALRRSLEGLPPEALREKAWGPREVVAHLVYWMEDHVAQAEALGAGRPIVPLEGTFDAVNARAVEAARGVPAAALLARFEAACAHLIACAGRPEGRSARLVLKKGSAPRPLDWFLRGEAEHIHWHLRILEEQARYDPVVRAEALAAAGVAFLARRPYAAALAHATRCEEALVAQVRAADEEVTTPLPTGRVLEEQVEALAGLDAEALEERFRSANVALCAAVREADPQDTVVTFWRLQMRRGTMRCTLDDAVARVEALLSGV